MRRLVGLVRHASYLSRDVVPVVPPEHLHDVVEAPVVVVLCRPRLLFRIQETALPPEPRVGHSVIEDRRLDG